MPLLTTIRMTSDMSVWRRLLMTDGVMVRIPWNRSVPMTTFTMLALWTEAPPRRIAATAGKAM